MPENSDRATGYPDYEDAVDRAKSLRPLLPIGWRVIPVGNPSDGYRLAIQHEADTWERALLLETDEDVVRLLRVYIGQLDSRKGYIA